MLCVSEAVALSVPSKGGEPKEDPDACEACDLSIVIGRSWPGQEGCWEEEECERKRGGALCFWNENMLLQGAVTVVCGQELSEEDRQKKEELELLVQRAQDLSPKK